MGETTKIENILRVKNLACSRGNRKLFSGLTFDLQPGSWLQVKGSNGSGKSSLLKILAGLLPATAGHIDGEGKYSRDLLYLGHKTGIQSRLTSFENLKWWFKIRTMQKNEEEEEERGEKNGLKGLKRLEGLKGLFERRKNLAKGLDDHQDLAGDLNNNKMDLDRLENALEYWGLVRFRHVLSENLSAGQCQRLALARLVLLPVKLWILDEPGNALDADAMHLFEKLLEKHLDRQGSAVIVSHSPLNLTGMPAKVVNLEI